MSLIMSQERRNAHSPGYVETCYDDELWHQLHITAEDTEGPTEEAASVGGVRI